MNAPTELFDGILAQLPAGGTLLWLFFAAIAIYTAVHATVFWYHWHTYNISPAPFKAWTYILYGSGIAVFLTIIFFSIVSITS